MSKTCLLFSDDIAFRALAARYTPDCRAVSGFRKDQLAALWGINILAGLGVVPARWDGAVGLGQAAGLRKPQFLTMTAARYDSTPRHRFAKG